MIDDIVILGGVVLEAVVWPVARDDLALLGLTKFASPGSLPRLGTLELS
jgi:hypothetical protein